MSTAFNARHGLVMLTVSVWGPAGERVLRLALDTGASCTMISAERLESIGYHPSASSDLAMMTSAGSIHYVPRLTVDRIRVLDQERVVFPVVAHILPPTATIDGVLGLDFMRGQRLVVDFRAGEVSLS